MELSPDQLAILQRLVAEGFSIAAFPMYANAIGVRRGDCAALLAPASDGALHLQGEPCYLVDGNLAVAVTRAGKKQYVWKKKALDASPETEAQLKQFGHALRSALLAIE